MPGNDRPRKATTRSWPSSGCAPGSGRTQSASRRVSLGKIPNDCTHGRATNPSEADTVVGGREASTCRCDASWPRQANWVKITPSASAISNCSQELSRRSTPVTAPPNAVSEPANSMERAAQGARGRGQSGQGPERLQPVRKRLPRISTVTHSCYPVVACRTGRAAHSNKIGKSDTARPTVRKTAAIRPPPSRSASSDPKRAAVHYNAELAGEAC